MPDAAQTEDARVALIERLWNDPEARSEMESVIARRIPGAASHMPAQVARVETDKLRKEVQDALKQEREKTEKRETERALADERRKIKEHPELRITDEEIPHVEKIMTEELVGNHVTAAELYRQRQAREAVGAPQTIYSTMQVPGVRGAGGDDYKGLVEDPDAWARGMAEKIHGDFARGHGDRWM